MHDVSAAQIQACAMSDQDVSFHYAFGRLDNDVVALEPFDPTVHLGESVKRFKQHPDLLKHMAFPPMDDEAAFARDVWQYIRTSPAELLFAVHDKTKAPAPSVSSVSDASGKTPVAGFVTLSNTNPLNAATELGIILFPEFHHTHVAANAVGLVLQWLLDAPSAQGLGLRRVEWKTHVDNAASRKLAASLGFTLEGICRWERVAQPGKPGAAVDALQARNGTDAELPGLHTALYSIVWDEWEARRPDVVAAMERKKAGSATQ